MNNHRKKYFESFASEWDKMFTAEDLEVLAFFIESFKIREGYRVADLGCGTGVMFDLLRRKVGESGLVVGIDFSPQMIHRAKMNFPFDNIMAIDADVESLPLRSEYFDIAISFAAFAHFPHQEVVIKEASRILKKGGTFNVMHLMGSQELAAHHHKAGGPVAHDVVPDVEKMKDLFSGSNFRNVKVSDHSGLYLAIGTKG